MENLFKDLRYSLRMLARSPVFTLSSVLCLALSIGAGSSLFLFVDGMLLRPLPVDEPDRLVWISSYKGSKKFDSCSYPDYLDYKKNNEVFTGLMAYSGTQLSLRAKNQTEFVGGQLVSPNYFSVLGIRPQIGRAWNGEETGDSETLVVLGHDLWQRRFGGDSQVLGETVFLNKVPFTVIGVAPKNFRGTQFLSNNNDLWIPLSTLPQLNPGSDRLTRRGSRWLELMGRLKPGISLEQAQEPMRILARSLGETYPDTNQKINVALYSTGLRHPQERDIRVGISIAMMGIAGLILLIAGANVTGLLLARVHSRRKETGIRFALGAKRTQVIRQFLMENLLLFLAGGCLSLVLAFWTSSFLSSFEPPGVGPIGLDFSVNFRVVFFTLLISLVPGLFFGLLPVLQISKSNPIEALRVDSFAANKGYRPLRLRNIFVVAQIAISLLLLIAAGLLIRSLQNTLAVDTGFENSETLMTSLHIDRTAYTGGEATVFFQQLIERLELRPEVRSASLAGTVPLGSASDRQGFYIDGHEPPKGRDTFPIHYSYIRPGFFETLGIPLLQGRDFTDHEGPEGPWVAIINQTMAERYWPNENPIGNFFRDSSHKPPRSLEIVGIVGSGKYQSLSEGPRSFVFLPHQQNLVLGTLNLLVHGDEETEKLDQIVRSVVQELDKDVPLFGATSAEEMVNKTLLPARLGAFFLSAWGLLALTLATIGIYSVVSYGIINRTFEISMRIALGARPRQIMAVILREGLVLFVIGAILGLAMAFVLTGFIGDFLFQVEPQDPGLYIQVLFFFAGIVLLASFVPALRAIRVNPVSGLQEN